MPFATRCYPFECNAVEQAERRLRRSQKPSTTCGTFDFLLSGTVPCRHPTSTITIRARHSSVIDPKAVRNVMRSQLPRSSVSFLAELSAACSLTKAKVFSSTSPPSATGCPSREPWRIPTARPIAAGFPRWNRRAHGRYLRTQIPRWGRQLPSFAITEQSYCMLNCLEWTGQLIKRCETVIANRLQTGAQFSVDARGCHRRAMALYRIPGRASSASGAILGNFDGRNSESLRRVIDDNSLGHFTYRAGDGYRSQISQRWCRTDRLLY